jgi:DNA-binding response OmpR family regulator
MAKRILLAEDEPNIVESIRFLLQRSGYEVSVCDNGREVLDAVRESPPDVLVLDVMLPELDGFEVLRRLREHDPERKLPILVLTAKGQREDRERAVQAGADLFIAKPFANAELIAAVNELADKSEG